jgi:hypothetical protein
MRLLKRGLLAFAVLIGLLAGALAVNHWYETNQSRRFYAAHPMLRTMDETVPGSGRATGWERFTPILLQRVPVGSTRADAIRLLAEEGFECIPSTVPWPHSLGCWTRTRPSNVPRWHIQLELDQSDRVAGGRVMMLKATA